MSKILMELLGKEGGRSIGPRKEGGRSKGLRIEGESVDGGPRVLPDEPVEVIRGEYGGVSVVRLSILNDGVGYSDIGVLFFTTDANYRVLLVAGKTIGGKDQLMSVLGDRFLETHGIAQGINMGFDGDTQQVWVIPGDNFNATFRCARMGRNYSGEEVIVDYQDIHLCNQLM